MATFPDPAIVIDHLTKDFSLGWSDRRLRAVDDLCLEVPAGQVFGLLGPNGSGKSTTIKVMLGLLEPSAGRCDIFGVPSREVGARVAVGYLPESPYFYRHLTGAELVRFYGRICGVSGARLKTRVPEVIQWVGLAAAADRRVGTYSKGMLQRIGLAQALVHDPRLVILDEPTAGVDPVGAAEISELILQLKAQGKTVLVTSHLLAQIEDICDRVAILDRGRLLVEGAVPELVGQTDRQALVVEAMPAGELEQVRAWLEQRGHRVLAVEQPRARLDRVFLEKVGRDGEAGR